MTILYINIMTKLVSAFQLASIYFFLRCWTLVLISIVMSITKCAHHILVNVYNVMLKLQVFNN